MTISAPMFGSHRHLRLVYSVAGILLLSLPALQYQCDGFQQVRIAAEQSAGSVDSSITLLRAMDPLTAEQKERAARAIGAGSYQALADRSGNALQQSIAARGDWNGVRLLHDVEKGLLYGLPTVVALFLLALGVGGRPQAAPRKAATQSREQGRSSSPTKSVAVERAPVATFPTPEDSASHSDDLLPLRQREFLVIAPRAVPAAMLAAAIASIDGRALGNDNEYSTQEFDLIEVQSRSDESLFSVIEKNGSSSVATSWPEIGPAVQLQVLLQICASAFLDDFEAQAMLVAAAIGEGAVEGVVYEASSGTFAGYAFRILSEEASQSPPTADTLRSRDLSSDSEIPEDVREILQSSLGPDFYDVASEAGMHDYLSNLTEAELQEITLGLGVSDVGTTQTRKEATL